MDLDPTQTVTATLTLSNTSVGSLTTTGTATYASGTGIWTITDTVANVNTALAALSFSPVANNDQDATISTMIVDQDGAGPSAGTITLNVTPVNDPPTATNLTTTSNYNEGDASVAITDIVVSEVDVDPNQIITATLTLSNAAVGSLSTSNAASYNATTGVWLITGTVANVNTALAAVSFIPVANNNLNATISTVIMDQDGAGPASGVISLNVTSINDLPTTVGIANVVVPQGAPDKVIDLSGSFMDIEDADTSLIYSVESSSHSTLFTATTIDLDADTLTLDFDDDYYGVSTIVVKATDSDLGTVTTSFTVTVNRFAKILFTTEGNATVGGSSTGVTGWQDNEIIELGDPGLTLGTATGGDLTKRFDLNNFAASDTDINALHFVSAGITIGNSNSVALQAGDLLLSTDGTETLTGSNSSSINVTADDVFVFRPDVEGDYSSGNFLQLFENLPGDGTNVSAITLVESDTIVGDITLASGTFLFGKSLVNSPIYFTPGDLGAATIGTYNNLFNPTDEFAPGSPVLPEPITGLELIESQVSIGGVNLNVGDLIASIGTAGQVIDGLAVEAQDMFVIRASQTNIGSGTTVGSASLFFDGSDFDLSSPDNEEKIQGIALQPDSLVNAPSTAINLNSTSNYNEGENSVDITNIVVSDADTDPVQSITATLTLSNINTGALSTSGTATYNAVSGVWSITDSMANVNVALANVAFIPLADNDIDSSIISHVHDQNGVGPIDGVISLNVTPANDAPLATNLVSVANYTEDDATVDLANIVVSDLDTNPVQSITTTLTLSDVNAGSLSTSGNASYNPLTGVWSVTNTIANVNLALANVKFLPGADYDLNATIATRVVDQDGAGPADGVINLNVTAVNDLPTATNLTSGASYTEGDLSVALEDIVVTDVDVAVNPVITANLQLSDITTGTLTASGGASYDVATGLWEITDSLANVNTALAAVSFVPTTDNDVNAAITTHIQDQSGGGPVDGVISLSVLPVNDAPAATNLTSTASYNEDDASVDIADIVVSDIDTRPDQVITATLKLADVSAGFLTTPGGASFDIVTGIWTLTDSVGNFNSALSALSFIPVADGELDTTISVHIEDQDAAGPADGLITLDVTARNDVPTGSDKVITVIEDGAYKLQSPDFGFSDVDSADSLVSVKVTSLESQGSLTLGGIDVILNQVVSRADIDAGLLTFSPAANEEGSAYDQFSFTVNDGTVDSTQSATLTFDVTAVPDQPMAADSTLVIVENSAYTFSTTDFGFSDPDSGDTLVSLTITQLATVGTLSINGTAVALNQTISKFEVDSGHLVFTPNSNESGLVYDSFQFSVNDGGLESALSSTITLSVSPANTAPIALDSKVSVIEDTVFVFSVADFGFDDADPGDALQAVTITGLTGSGTLKLGGVGGVDVVINSTVTKSDLAGGLFQYTPAANVNGIAIDEFQFNVNDGTIDSVGSASMVIDISAINDVPTGVVNLIGLSQEDATLTIDTSAIGDADSLGAFSYQWLRDGVNIAGETGIGYTTGDADVGAVLSATVQYVDGDGTPETLVSSPSSVIGNINDAPTSTGNATLTLDEDSSDIIFSIQDLFSDVDGETLNYDFSALAGSGLVDSVQLDSPGNIKITLAPNAFGQETVNLVASDAAGETAVSAFTLIVNPVNDSPVATPLTLVIDEDAAPSEIDLQTLFADVDEITGLTYSINNVDDAGLLSASLTDETLTLIGSENQFGTASVTVQATDSEGATAIAVITVQINAINDAPVATIDVDFTDEDHALTRAADLGVLINDFDADPSDTLSVVQIISGELTFVPGDTVAGSQGGEFVIGSDGSYSFDPGEDFQGLAVGETAETQVLYVVTDDSGAVSTVPLRIVVSGLNDAITAMANSGTVRAGESLNVATQQGLLANVTDIDLSDSLQIVEVTGNSGTAAAGTTVSGSSGGTFTIQSDGSYSVEAGADFRSLLVGESRMTEVSYTISDGQGGTETAILSIEIFGTAVESANESFTTALDEVSAVSPTVPIQDTVVPEIVVDDKEVTDDSVSEEATDDSSADEEESGDTTNDEEASDSEQGVLENDVGNPFDDVTPETGLRLLGGGISDVSQLSSTVPELSFADVSSIQGLSAGALLSSDINSSISLIGTTDSLVFISSPDYKKALDETRNQSLDGELGAKEVQGGTLTITAGISIGYVLWLVRSGVIMSSVITALPAWRLIDPLPILSSLGTGPIDEGESIQELVEVSNMAHRSTDGVTAERSIENSTASITETPTEITGTETGQETNTISDESLQKTDLKDD